MKHTDLSKEKFPLGLSAYLAQKTTFVLFTQKSFGDPCKDFDPSTSLLQ